MRILVVGAGAVGGYFGGRLAEAGRDVTFLVREARAERLKRDGLRLATADGVSVVRPKLVLAKDIAAEYDLVLLGVKAYSLAAAMDDFAAAVGPATMILPMLNGMAHIDALTARFGESAVLGGSTQISTDVEEDGTIRRLTAMHDFVYGERNGAVTERVEAVRDAVSHAGFDDELSTDVVGFMWQKWVMLAAMASITCLFRSTVGEVASTPRGVETAAALLDETSAIAVAEGHAVAADFLEKARRRLTDPASTLTSSMLRDMQRGAPVEVEHVIGDLLARGESHGLKSPLLRAAYVQLALYERLRAAK
jgi:2-dehydropantoate 2-reductase